MSRHPRFARTALALIGLALALPVRADGGFVGGQSAPREPAQAALLRWDAAAGREELTLQVSFEFTGAPADFGWILAVPSLPELSAADPSPFPSLDGLTRPLYRARRVDCWGDKRYATMGPPAADDGVEILATETVGIYEALTVTADDAGALLDSLTAWGYLHTGNAELVTATLQYYVDKSWAFVVLRTDAIEASAAYQAGALAPIRLAFAAAEPVYPLRISQLSSPHRNWVDLFVVADRRLEGDLLEPHYANAIDADELAAIEQHYPRLAGLLGEGDFLTRLSGGLYTWDMESDLILRPAAVNSEFLEVYYSGWPLAEALGLIALAGLAVRRRRRA
jgi:hypothetical protein